MHTVQSNRRRLRADPVLAILILVAGWDPPRATRTDAEPGITLLKPLRDIWRNRPLVRAISAGAISNFVNVGRVTKLGSFSFAGTALRWIRSN